MPTPEEDAEERKKDKANALVLAERTRALEQVKRLYAVVMGFAILSCITNAFLCGRKLLLITPVHWDAYSILITQVFSFLSLISLFLLASERMLDRKYLQPASPKPTAGYFLFDLITIGAPTVFFVLLSNIFPSTSLTVDEIKAAPGVDLSAAFPDAVDAHFWWFILGLAALYVMDVVLLAIHRASIDRNAKLVRSYRIWIGTNATALLAMILVLFNFNALNVSFCALNLAAVVVFLCHVVRFLVDFCLTFDSYFPPEEITP